MVFLLTISYFHDDIIVAQNLLGIYKIPIFQLHFCFFQSRKRRQHNFVLFGIYLFYKNRTVQMNA